MVTVKLEAAIAVDGNILRRGTLVELQDSEAKNLLERGKAVLATTDDEAAQPAAKKSKAAKTETTDKEAE